MGRGAAMLAGALALTACADDPFDFGSPRSCELPDQNAFAYGLMQRLYLFADEVEAGIDPATYESPSDLVRDVRVDPDRWSRVSDRAKTDALFEEGKFIGLGYRAMRDDDGDLVIASVHGGSPASRSGLKRGDHIRAIGGLRIAQIDEEDRWSEVYGEDVPGVSVELLVQPRAEEIEEPVSLVKDWIEIETVPHDDVLQLEGRPIGYVVFSTFVSPSDDALDAAFARIRESGAREVIVDLRYNGGGLLSVARHLVGLLVGDVAPGDDAYRIEYNEEFSGENTDRSLERYEGSIRDVQHVVFLTSGSTLSASELVINAVRPYAPVTVIGDVTGGKPVGSRHIAFCDKVAAPITFKVVNADGEGDYFDGIAADCTADDDLGHALGDPEEASLAAALGVLRSGQCPDGTVAGEHAEIGFSPGYAARPEGPRRALVPVPDRPRELDGEF